MYEKAPHPTDREWYLWQLWVQEGQSVARVAFLEGMERVQVRQAIQNVKWWMQDSGYARRYREAKSLGFSDADARLHAEQEAGL